MELTSSVCQMTTTTNVTAAFVLSVSFASRTIHCWSFRFRSKSTRIELAETRAKTKMKNHAYFLRSLSFLLLIHFCHNSVASRI